MTTNTATVTRTAAPFWRNGFHPQRIPLWLGALVALLGATITVLAVKADWMFLGDAYRFALRQTDVAMACGGSKANVRQDQANSGQPAPVDQASMR